MALKSIRPVLLFLALACAACGARASQTPATPPALATFTATSTLVPSPVPVSPTSSPTLLPVPRTFTEAFDLQPATWSLAEVDNGQPFAGPTTRDGFLVFDLASSNQWAYALYTVHDYADVTIETEMQSRTAGDGAGGVVCRYDENKGWYEFNVRQDQTYQLLFGQWLAPGVARYTPLYQSRSEKITSEANRIGLQCQGNILTPSINGVQLRRWQEQKFGLQEGQSGLSASSFDDAPFTIAFDWVKVSEP
jgi:hypothetical protein